MKDIINKTTEGIFNLVSSAREMVAPLSKDQRASLLHECDGVIDREQGSVKKVAAEIIRAAILVENGV